MTKKRGKYKYVKFRTGRTGPDKKPKPPEGKEWCPGCDKAITVNSTGFLHEHGRCGRIYVGRPDTGEAVLYLLTPPSKREHEEYEKLVHSPRAVAAYAAKRGECRNCEKKLPGERTLCGACGVRLGP
jgi:hypothetical protein